MSGFPGESIEDAQFCRQVVVDFDLKSGADTRDRENRWALAARVRKLGAHSEGAIDEDLSHLLHVEFCMRSIITIFKSAWSSQDLSAHASYNVMPSLASIFDTACVSPMLRVLNPPPPVCSTSA